MSRHTLGEPYRLPHKAQGASVLDVLMLVVWMSLIGWGLSLWLEKGDQIQSTRERVTAGQMP